MLVQKKAKIVELESWKRLHGKESSQPEYKKWLTHKIFYYEKKPVNRRKINQTAATGSPG